MEIRDPKVFLDYHARMHERTVRVIDCIPPADLDWAPGTGRFSFADMIRHLAGIERYMYAEAAAGRPNRYPGHGPDLADGRDAVRAYYDRLHSESREIFASLMPTRTSSGSRPRPERRSRSGNGCAPCWSTRRTTAASCT